MILQSTNLNVNNIDIVDEKLLSDISHVKNVKFYIGFVLLFIKKE